MSHPPELHVLDSVFPALAGIPFILIMSCVPEPARRRFNAVFVAGASGAYLSGGFGLWELVFPAVVGGFVAYRGLESHRMIGLAWLLHSGWDVLHHFYGHPIWPFASKSSWGCFIFDAVIAVWFLMGAPSVFGVKHTTAAPNPSTSVERPHSSSS